MHLTSEAKVLTGIGLATVVILVGAVFFLTNNPATAPSNIQSNPKTADPQYLRRADSHVVEASPSAKLTITEFSDFQCPACRAAQPTVDQALNKYKNRISFVYRHFPLPQHKNAEKAIQAAEAANEQGKFWPYHDKLFAVQDEWAELDGSKAEEKFVQYAGELGLDVNRFKQSLDSNKFDSRVKEDLNDGIKLGVNSTPTFYFNYEKYTGDFNPSNFNAKIEGFIK